MSLLSSPQSLDGLLRDLSDEELGEMDEEAMAPPGTPGVVQQEQLEKQPAASDQNDEGGATETISAKEAGAESQAETVGSNQSEPIEITGDVLRITLYGLASNDAYLTAGGEKKRGPTKSADISFNHEMCLKYATGISDLGALAARALEFRLPGVERVGMIQVTTVQKGKFEMASPWKDLPGSQPINVTFVKDAPADVRITLYFHGDQLFVERLRVAREAYQTFLTNAHAKLGRKLKAADIQVLFDHKADTIKNALGLKAGQPPKNCNVLEQIEGVVKRHMESDFAELQIHLAAAALRNGKKRPFASINANMVGEQDGPVKRERVDMSQAMQKFIDAWLDQWISFKQNSKERLTLIDNILVEIEKRKVELDAQVLYDSQKGVRAIVRKRLENQQALRAAAHKKAAAAGGAGPSADGNSFA